MAAVVAAVVAVVGLATLPESAVAVWREWYARAQPVVSRASAWSPVAVLDGLLVVGAVAGGLMVRRAWRDRQLLRPVATLFVVSAAAWAAFLLTWGLHYRVATLEARLGITTDALTPARGEATGAGLVDVLNTQYAPAHAEGWPSREALPGRLRPLLAEALPMVGVDAVAALPVARATLIEPYFRAAGIDGMINPFGLEVIVNTRALPVELPALVAHEYAHLAGFADEADASVVAWMACSRGSAPYRYSAALAILPHVLAGLPTERRRRLIDALEDGPRRDLANIAARLRDQRPWVHALAWQTYDGFLRANRVGEGVARYDAVARVVVAAGDVVSGSLTRPPSSWPARAR